MPDVKPRIPDEAEKSKIWKLTEISERSQLRTLRLPDSLLPARVCIQSISNALPLFFERECVADLSLQEL